jgi:DNA-binding MarR family transcriptional regulator
MKSEPKPLDTALPGGLDHSVMMRNLGYNIALASIPTTRLFNQHIGKPFELKQVEFTIITLLASNADVTAKQLSLALGMPAPNLTVILDRLEGRDLLVRTRSDSDRRVQYISLTRTGAAMAKKATACAERMEKEVRRYLTPAESDTLFELLKKVAVQGRS